MTTSIAFLPHTPLQSDLYGEWSKTITNLNVRKICLVISPLVLDLIDTSNYDKVIVLAEVSELEKRVASGEDLEIIQAYEKEYSTNIALEWSSDRTLKNKDYDDVVKLTAYLIDKIKSVVEKEQISMAISEKIFLPHRILHHVLSKKGGRHIYPIPERFFRRFYFEETEYLNWPQGNELYHSSKIDELPVIEEIETRLDEIVNKQFKGGGLAQHQKKFKRGRFKKLQDINLVKEITSIQKVHNLDFYGRYLKNTSENFKNKVQLRIAKKNKIKVYDDLKVSSPPKAPYVLYLMTFQPEFTIEGAAPKYINQVETVHFIARNLPKGMSVVVKENPMSIGLRDENYYKRLATPPNVLLMDEKYDSHSLIKNSYALITLCGTAGLEALLFGKPIVVLGNVFYKDFKNAYFAENLNECIDILSNKIRGQYEYDKEEALKILKSVYYASYPGKLISSLYPNQHREGDNLKNLKESFLTEANKTFRNQ